MGTTDDDLLADQIRYYEARAPIYEKLYLREGPYAVDDPAWTANWERETGELERFVEGLPATGRVLELACGNGLWTRFLARRASSLVAVDSSPTMLARNREWIGDPRVSYLCADLFDWSPGTQRFDLIFAGFFLSHVPPDRWISFWRTAAGWLAPGGLLAFVDDCWAPDRPRSSQRMPDGPDHAHIRELGGDTYTIVKRFFRPQELTDAFVEADLDAEATSTGEHFLFGTARPVR